MIYSFILGFIVNKAIYMPLVTIVLEILDEYTFPRIIIPTQE